LPRCCTRQDLRGAPAFNNPLAPKHPPLPAKAKSVIFLFMAGGPSHMETFDPKPLLNELSGQARPKEFGEAKYQFIQSTAKLLGTKRTFKNRSERHRRLGFVSARRHLRRRSRRCPLVPRQLVVHSAAQYELFSGRVVPARRAWARGLPMGSVSESESLPSYVVMPDPHGALPAGQPMYSQGFLPAVYPAHDVSPEREACP